MRRNDVDPAIMDFLFAREVVRRLGFEPEEIFFVVYTSGTAVVNGATVNLGGPVISLELRRGGLEFRWTIGATALRAENIQAAYERACAAWNENALGIGHGDFLASEPARMSMGLMVALQDKGFRFAREPMRSPTD